MNNINISNSKNIVLNNSECGKEVEITSNKKVSTSCAQKVEHCNTDASGSRNTDDMAADDVGRLYSLPNDKLFLDPPPKEDCPICMLPMPHASGACGVGKTYMACCNTMICSGCSMAEDDEVDKGNIKAWCAFCRVPIPTRTLRE